MTEQEYKMIEDCGAAEMSPRETAEIMEISLDEFLNDENAVKKYRKGQLLTKLRIRQSIIKMAKEGVPTMTKVYQEISNHEIGISILKEDVKFPSLEVSMTNENENQ